MTRRSCLGLAAGLSGLGAAPAPAAEGCAALPELQQAAQRPPVDEVTREKVAALPDDARGPCAAGEHAAAATRLANVRARPGSDREEPPTTSSN